MNWGKVTEDALTGAIVAVVAALLAFAVTVLYTDRRRQAETQRARQLAAVEEFYRVVGDFFATWKSWEFHVKQGSTGHPYGPDRHSEMAAAAAAVEGAYESLLIRTTLERCTDQAQERPAPT